MKLAAWNVNSLKVRLPQLLDWLDVQQPDVVCLQETKLEDVNFPQQAIADAGYAVAFHGQKTYNGVALLSRLGLDDVLCNNPHFPDPQKRLIAATVQGVRVIRIKFRNDTSRYKSAANAQQTRDRFTGTLRFVR